MQSFYYKMCLTEKKLLSSSCIFYPHLSLLFFVFTLKSCFFCSLIAPLPFSNNLFRMVNSWITAPRSVYSWKLVNRRCLLFNLIKNAPVLEVIFFFHPQLSTSLTSTSSISLSCFKILFTAPRLPPHSVL